HQLLRHVEKAGHGGLDAVHHGYGVGIAALFEHGQVHGALAVHPYDVDLNLLGVLGIPHVGHGHRGPAHGFQRQAVDVVNVPELAVGINVIGNGPDADVASRKNQVRVIHRAHDVHGAQLVRL